MSPRHAQPPPRGGPPRTWPAVAAVLVVGLIVAACVVAFHHRAHAHHAAAPVTPGAPPSSNPTASFTDARTTATIIGAAKSDVSAIAGYDYRHLGADLAAGTAATTGVFRTSYESSVRTTVKAAAAKHHTVQTFAVQNAGVCAISSDGTLASAMVFGRETVTSDTSQGRTPVVSALVVGVTMTLVKQHWLVSVLQQGVGPITTPPGTSQLTDAAVAGRAEVTNLLTYSRAAFDADYGRAVAGATGSLHADLLAQRAAVLSGLKSGGYDLTGSIVGLAVQSATGSSVVLLVAAQSTQVASSGTQQLADSPRLLVTMRNVNAHWLASAVTTVPGA